MTNKNAVLSRRVAQYLLFVSWLLPAWALGDVWAVVESVERCPRTQRLAAYEAAMVRTRMSEADRMGLIRAFSRHTKRTYQRLGVSEPEP